MTQIALQGQILAVWILAVKLPNSDLNLAVVFFVDVVLSFFKEKDPPKNHRKLPHKIHPEFVLKNSHRISAEAYSILYFPILYFKHGFQMPKMRVY